MQISVIIPTCNRNDLLSKCLNALIPGIQTIDADAYEVIVTDDSVDGIAHQLIQTNYPFAKWVKGPCKGPAANRNNGVKNANGEWLVFVDDDCVPCENLLHEYANGIKLNKGTEVFEGFIGVDREKKSFIEEAPINETGGFLWSCNFMIEARLFKELNGFDEAFPYAAMEDVDLQYRIKKLNKKIEFIREAGVIHPWRTEKKIVWKTKKRFQSILYFLKKNPEMNGKLNAVYFFKYSVKGFKAVFIYTFRFRFKGLDKQLIISLMHLYFGLLLLFKKTD